MSENWIVQNLERALEVWNDKLTEMWTIITQSPEAFKGGTIWSIVTSIHGALQAIGYALLVLFFVIGVMKTCGTIAELKKPEHAVKLFIRFAIAKGVITHGLELMMSFLSIIQGVIGTIMSSAGAHCNHINHVETQLPYAISVACLSFVCYILAGLFDKAGITWLSLPIGVILTVAFLFFMKKKTAKA